MLSGRHALVMDFGVAKAVSEASGRNKLTTAGVALGTPAYMAPEQASADPHIDHRVDIYALGVVGYELLAGRPPFTGGSPQQVLAAHVMQAPELVSAHRPSLSPALSGVIMKALEKRPADRWQTAEEMVIQLEPLMTPSGGMTPTQTRPVSAVPMAGSRRSRLLLLVAAILVLGGAGYFFAQRGGSTPSLSLTRTSRLTSAPGVEALPAISPDGQFLAYNGRTNGRPRIYLQPADGGRPVNITEGMEGAQASPDWSPDGRRLLFISYEATAARILTMPPTGGDVRRIYSAGYDGDVPEAAKWSPDGTRIAFDLGDSLMTMAADGSGLTLLGHAPDAHSLTWSPDGRWIAGVRGNASFIYGGSAFGNLAASTVFVIPAAGGRPIMVSDSTSLNVSPVWLPDGSGILYVSSGGGGRDVYLQAIESGRAEGTPRRITTGLDAHTIALSRDGKRLVYSKYSRDLNVLMVQLSQTGPVDARSAVPITRGNQASEMVRLSPDAKWLVYDSDLNGNADLFIVPSDGGTPRQLTDDPSDDLNPDWSADGSLIAFHSFRTGNRDVFTVGADGSGLAQVTTDTVNDWYAIWGPDNNTLAYSKGGGGGLTLVEARRESRTAPWGPPSERAPGLASGTTADRTAFLYTDFGAEESRNTLTQAMSVPSGGGPPTVLFQPPPWFDLGWTRMGPDGQTLYMHSADSLGLPAYWAVDLRTKALRKVVAFDPSDTRTVRGPFDTDGSRFYFVAGEHQADIWVATVEGLTP
jgi:Tol biopolymer transport system component